MMSQGSKNSAGRSSDAQEADSILLFPRQGLEGSTKVKEEHLDSVATTASSSFTPGEPGVIAIRPGVLNTLNQTGSADQNKVNGGAPAKQNGADSSHKAQNSGKKLGVSSPNSQPNKQESTEVLHLEQQFNQLQLLNTNQSLANTKEKTPMCLINELARFNKVQHQYTLVDEQGPPHKKTFYVKLKLGDEEYSSQGASIKKGQHAAASLALNATKFRHPPPKPESVSMLGFSNTNNITPTVELNALAMKRGEPAIYKPVDSPRQQPYYPNLDFRGMYNQRYHYPRIPRMFYTSLKVGPRIFYGEGPTRQAARHMAANKALKMLRYLPIPNQDATTKVKEQPPVSEPEQTNEKDQLKSEISLVHEIALKNNVEVIFEVTRESGPPHMKVFVTQCRVGERTTEAQGNSKKVSKKKAAEQMLEELRQLPTTDTVPQKPKPRLVPNKKKSRNLIKVQKADPSYGVGINPISRLIQIMQAQKKKEPIYTLITERGLPRRREFVMQVCVEDKTCTGTGPNKKLAKRSAAEEMLELLGFSQPTPQPAKPALKTGVAELSPGDKKVTFSDADETNTNGKSRRQLMPGLLFLPDSTHQGNGLAVGREAGGDNPVSNIVLNNSNLRPEAQLANLSKAHNIELDFDDFSGKECLCRITLLKNPSHTVHGTGSSKETARDAAATEAIKYLTGRGSVGVPPSAGEGDTLISKQGRKVQGNPLTVESE